jgi:LmbE family N-acetylglucosaminyl deacetylase
MAIVAHPDDIEFSCAGTMARWARAGARICYVLCTSGDVGIAEAGMTRERATEIREGEARRAAEIAGVHEVVFLREPDGMLTATLELRRKLVREIRRFRPEVVVTGDPTVVWAGEDYINHPDHRAAALAAVDACFPAAGQPNLFEEIEQQEGFKAHKVRKVYATSWVGATTYVSIDETIEVKIDALRAHKSQMRDWDPGDSIRQWAAESAKGKEMTYAESFRVVTLENDETWAKLHGDSASA